MCGSNDEEFGVYRHADNGIDTDLVECVHLLLAANTSCDNELPFCQVAQSGGSFQRKAAHQSFAIHVRIEKCRCVRLELWNGGVRRQLHLFLPALHRYSPVPRVDPRNHSLHTDGGGQFGSEERVHGAVFRRRRKQRGANDDPLRPGIKNPPCTVNRMNSTAYLAGQLAGDPVHKSSVIARAHRRIKIDELHKRKARELPDPVFEIIERQAEFFALHQLNNATAKQINRWNQHGNLTGTPNAERDSFSERALDTPKWKMLARSEERRVGKECRSRWSPYH